MGGPQTWMALPSWVSPADVVNLALPLQESSLIAGSMQPSKCPGISCQRLLIHLPDLWPSLRLCSGH